MTFTNVTFALDLSLSSPGFAVLAISDGQPIVLETSHVKTKASKPHGYRLDEIMVEMERYYLTYKPEHVVREKGFSRFAATTQAIFKTVGCSDVTAYWHGHNKVAEIPPTTVKKIVTGSGKASKDEVADAVRRILQIDNPDFFANDDESDAAGVGLAYMYEKGLIKQ